MLAGYRVEGLIGAGGFSLVYKAFHYDSGQHRAVKVMRPGLFTGESRALLMEEFRRMVRLPAHPGVVRVFDPGICGGSLAGEPFLPMELVEGALPLDRFVAEHGLRGREIIRLFAKVCDAVEAVHRAGFLHRDLKPGNILVTREGQPKIVDFGIAQRLAGSASMPDAAGPEVGGAMTLQYASPEQVVALGEADPRGDVHCLGVILYTLLTGGRFPFEFPGPPGPPGGARSVEEWKQAILSVKRLPLNLAAKHGSRRADLLLRRIVGRAIAREPDRRYPSAGLFARALRQYLWLTLPAVAFPGSGRAIVLIASAVVAMFAAEHLGVPIAYRWTDLHLWFENTMLLKMPQVAAATGPDVMSTVRMLVVDDDTDWEAIARHAGLEGVSNDNVFSTRRVWGWFLERLAESGARPLAVVFDMTFREVPAAAEFSESLAEGVRKITSAGVPVAVGLRDWPRPGNDEPNIAEPLRGLVAWGGTTLAAGVGDINWAVHLAMTPAGTDRVLSGLSLTALSLARRPERVPRIEMDQSTVILTLRYETLTGGAWLAPPNEAMPLRVRAFEIVVFDSNADRAPDSPLRPGDAAATITVHLPRDEVLHQATVSIQEASRASSQLLSTWFDARVIVVGNVRSTALDRFEFVGRGIRPGVEGHAVAIDSLLRCVEWKSLTWSDHRWLWLAAGAIGALAAVMASLGRFGRTLLIAGITLASALAIVFWYDIDGVLIDPWVQVFAVVMGAAMAWAARGQLESVLLLKGKVGSA